MAKRAPSPAKTAKFVPKSLLVRNRKAQYPRIPKNRTAQRIAPESSSGAEEDLTAKAGFLADFSAQNPSGQYLSHIKFGLTLHAGANSLIANQAYKPNLGRLRTQSGSQ